MLETWISWEGSALKLLGSFTQEKGGTSNRNSETWNGTIWSHKTRCGSEQRQSKLPSATKVTEGENGIRTYDFLRIPQMHHRGLGWMSQVLI